MSCMKVYEHAVKYFEGTLKNYATRESSTSILFHNRFILKNIFMMKKLKITHFFKYSVVYLA